jgi:hypothetical protein
VSIYDLGDGVPLRHTIINGDGDLVDAIVTLTVVDPNGVITTPGVDNTSTGVYEAEQIVPDVAGVWTYTWSSTGAVVDNTTSAFVVVDPTATAGAWATLGNVIDITGTAVTLAQLRQAQAVVELFVGRTPAADEQPIRPVDLHWLRQAVCWQAVWQKDQPGYTTRSSFTSMSQDSFQVNVAGRHDLHLAPLAARAVKNLTWMASRSVAIGRPSGVPIPAFNTEAALDYPVPARYWGGSL